jgi:hypothetical protein
VTSRRCVCSSRAALTRSFQHPPGRAHRGSTASANGARLALLPVPVGGPGIPVLHAVAGVGYGKGFAGNSHVFAPAGMLPAVKYLVEELGMDVNERDYEGNTVVHHAASRGDLEMIAICVEGGVVTT